MGRSIKNCQIFIDISIPYGILIIFISKNILLSKCHIALDVRLMEHGIWKKINFGPILYGFFLFHQHSLNSIAKNARTMVHISIDYQNYPV